MDKRISLRPKEQQALDPEAALALGEELYTSHYTPLYRYFFFRLRNSFEAEDLAQTVFVKAFKSLQSGQWDGGGDIHYLFTIARNTLIDYFRRAKHAPITSDEMIENVADTFTTDESVENREHSEIISAGLAKLSPPEAEAVSLRYISDMDYSAIAKIMGKREDAVRQLVHRGLKALRGHLEDDGLLM